MKAGDVFYFINFKFTDGSTANKILIILNTPQNDEPYLVCLTTSVYKKWRSKELGCHSDKNYYFIDAKQDNFDADTWIIFEKVYELDVAKLLNSCLKDGTYKLFELETTLLKALKDCIAKSKDIEQDYLEKILRKVNNV
jgi:hypothetical protein